MTNSEVFFDLMTRRLKSELSGHQGLFAVPIYRGVPPMTEEQFPEPPAEETEPALEDGPQTITITEPTIIVPNDDDALGDPA